MIASAATPAWYAIWLRSHHEHRVSEQLVAKGFHTFLPELRTWSRRFGPAHDLRVPMFPGYLFVREVLDKRRYVELLKVRGIVRVLEDGWSRLTPVPDEDVEAIQRISRAGLPVSPHAYLRQGARVRVLDGPLTGLEGIFIREGQAPGRLVVSMHMLGRSVAVEMRDANVTGTSAAGAHARA